MRGFTLIELIVGLAILGTILAVGIPTFKNTLENHHTRSSLSTLKRALERGRLLALSNTQETIVCPLKDNECVGDWSQPLAVFQDNNKDYKFDTTDILHLKYSNEIRQGYWQKKRINANYIKFTPEGFAFSSATTFLYCLNSGNTSKAKQLIINFQGRVRIKNYLSSRGTPFTNLNPLSCL